jgi:phosphoribosylformylglycinamidine (FGAM) synthase PurS component
MKCGKVLAKKGIREAGLAIQVCLPARATFFNPVIEDYRVEIEA